MTVAPPTERVVQALQLLTECCQSGVPRLVNAATHVARENGATADDVERTLAAARPEPVR